MILNYEHFSCFHFFNSRTGGGSDGEYEVTKTTTTRTIQGGSGQTGSQPATVEIIKTSSSNSGTSSSTDKSLKSSQVNNHNNGTFS